MKRNKNFQWVLWGSILLAVQANAGPARLKLSLNKMVQKALTNSPKLGAAQLAYESAKSEASAMNAAEFPRLGVSGNYFYQTYVPAFSVSPAAPQVAFGESNNWSAWATLNWNLWDFRSQHALSDSASALSESQKETYEAAERQLRLAVRLAYFQVQINLEQVRLLADSLSLSKAEYADIGHQNKYGSASKVDRLSAHQEVLNYQRQFWQAQANLAQSLRDLYALVGIAEPADLSSPVDARMKDNLPPEVENPTVWLTLDGVMGSRAELESEASVPPDDSVPQLKTYTYLADSARMAADAVHAQLFPKITLAAQAGYENPDGPILSTVQQNIVSVSASMPIFDWGQIVSDSDSKRKQSEVYLKDLAQAKLDLWRDWNKGKDNLRSLEHQETLNETDVSETRQLAKLTYQAYKAGGTRFLEVQTANVEALNAKIQAVANDVQILMQLAVLSSLAGSSN